MTDLKSRVQSLLHTARRESSVQDPQQDQELMRVSPQLTILNPLITFSPPVPPPPPPHVSLSHFFLSFEMLCVCVCVCACAAVSYFPR